MSAPKGEKNAPGKKARGRPGKQSPELVAEICLRLAAGETLRAIAADAHMPDQGTVYRWLAADADFRQQYARAREEQAHTIAELAVDEATSAKDAQLGRLAFDARKWFAAKLAPKVYGDKVQQEITGKDGAALPVVLYLPDNRRDTPGDGGTDT